MAVTARKALPGATSTRLHLQYLAGIRYVPEIPYPRCTWYMRHGQAMLRSGAAELICCPHLLAQIGMLSCQIMRCRARRHL